MVLFLVALGLMLVLDKVLSLFMPAHRSTTNKANGEPRPLHFVG